MVRWTFKYYCFISSATLGLNFSLEKIKKKKIIKKDGRTSFFTAGTIKETIPMHTKLPTSAPYHLTLSSALPSAFYSCPTTPSTRAAAQLAFHHPFTRSQFSVHCSLPGHHSHLCPRAISLPQPTSMTALGQPPYCSSRLATF